MAKTKYRYDKEDDVLMVSWEREKYFVFTKETDDGGGKGVILKLLSSTHLSPETRGWFDASLY